MDTLLQSLVIGIVQGFTEPLPISSSGHLVLVPWLLGWNDPFLNSLEFGVMLHMGTLLAIFVYFWRDWARLIPAAIRSLQTRSIDDPDARLAWVIAASLPPAAVLGFLFNDFFEEAVRQPIVIAFTLVIGGAILWSTDRIGRQERTLESLTFVEAFLIGCAQAVALVPGISRSGISISAGLGLGLTREAASRFSFLMAAPIIAGAGVFELKKMIFPAANAVHMEVNLLALVVGFAAALLTGLGAIHVLLRFVRTHRFDFFVGYRIVVAILVLLLVVVAGK